MTKLRPSWTLIGVLGVLAIFFSFCALGASVFGQAQNIVTMYGCLTATSGTCSGLQPVAVDSSGNIKVKLTGAIGTLTVGNLTSTGFVQTTTDFRFGTTGTLITDPADGQLNIRNNANTSGIGFDVTTDGTLAIRNRAQNADGILKAGTVNATSGYQVNGNAFPNATIGPSSPGGTASATLVMAGLGGAITTRTGKIVIAMSGNMQDGAGAGDGVKCQISYGTGTAPTAGAALTGNQVGPIQQHSGGSILASEIIPYGASWIVTGLTPGTTYWFDTAFAAITAGTATLTQASMTAYDIP